MRGVRAPLRALCGLPAGPAARLLAVAVAVSVAGLAAGCSREPATPSAAEPHRPTGAEGTSSLPSLEVFRPESRGHPDLAPPAGESRPLVVFLGDSLTAGYGLAEDQAFPALVGVELERRGSPVRVINGGISGDTSAGGLERVDWLLAQRPAIVVVELGANDGLRGQPLESIEANLRAIVEKARAAGARVLLAGMKIPPNYGPDYAAGFEAVFPRLARELEIELVPFLLEGVAARPELNLPDGIHPNAAGHEIVARTLAEALAPLLADASTALKPAA